MDHGAQSSWEIHVLEAFQSLSRQGPEQPSIQCWLYFEQEIGLNDIVSNSMVLGIYFVLMYLVIILNLSP